MNKPVLSIILQTRYALLTGSSAAITELATTKTVAAAKNCFIENPGPLRRYGARACFVLQDMLHGFAVTVWKYNANEGKLFARSDATGFAGKQAGNSVIDVVEFPVSEVAAIAPPAALTAIYSGRFLSPECLKSGGWQARINFFDIRI
ncbi:MAG TPA: hypothetical protein VFR09_09055 [Alphaproteobacteria bacterium]|nr:hypothetical protein [Alphaproteobacteria bacterium]